MTFRARLILGIAAIEGVFLVALVGAVLILGGRIADQRMKVQAGAKVHLATILLRDSVASNDAVAVRHLAREMIDGGEVVSVKVFDRSGAILAAVGGAGAPPRQILRERRPIVDDGDVVGAVTVEVSRDLMDQTLTAAYLGLGLTASTLLLLSGCASWMFGRHLARQLKVLRSSAEAVADGEYDIRLDETGPSEFAAVASAMNVMAAQIGKAHAEVSHDLADRKRALAFTFRHMTQGVAIFDAEGRLVEANDTFPDLIGLPKDAVVPGAGLDALVDIHAMADAYTGGVEGVKMEALCRSRDWLGPTMAFELPFPDGRSVAVQRTRLPDGGFIAIHEDVTRRRQDERRLLHAAKLTTLGRLATAAAHELNQPLNVIRLSADNAAARLAGGGATPDYLAEKLARISAQTERAARIIDHMRIFGRKPAEAPTLFDLGEAVRSAAEFFGETARLKGFQFDLSLEPGLLVSGHPALIEQVIANILSNALAALASTGAASPTVEIRAARRGGTVRVEIADNAGGVPVAVLPHIFEPFFTTKSDREGTGLGLSISYGIISDMGGRLEAENRDGGAVFSFELPSSPKTLSEPIIRGSDERVPDRIA